MRFGDSGGSPPPRGRGPRTWWASAAVLLLPGSLAAQAATGEVRGTVRDSAGVGILGASIAVLGATREAQSDGSGAFRLSGIAAGPAQLLVRRLGFAPDTITTTVPAGGVVTVAARLRPVAQQLAIVEVRERRQVYDARLEGVRARMEKRQGYFITPEKLRRANTPMLTDLLREVPGVRMSRSSANLPRSVRIRSNNCPPLVFIDGFPASAGEFDLDMIDPASVEAVEVHSGLASMPPEFGAARGLERCGVIAIWSRPAPGRPPRATNQRNNPAANLERLVAEGRVYTATQVDQVAAVDSAWGEPEYPDSLWKLRVGGRVVAEFVVNRSGTVEPNTFRVVSSTHPAFTTAVQRAVEGTRFSPAVRRGEAVSQVVQQPFVFTAPSGGSAADGAGRGGAVASAAARSPVRSP